MFPETELNRIDEDLIAEYYVGEETEEEAVEASAD
jgi:hypothetical protein